MATVTCAISGMRFECSYLDGAHIPHTAGYFHPIFALNHKQLYGLYSQYGRNQLTATDSYLLFCAFLKHSGYVSFNNPITRNPNEIGTKQLVANNLGQLVRVMEQSALIQHPAFKQPHFKIYFDNSHITQIPSWILAWEANLAEFQLGLASAKQKQDLLEIENRLTLLIKSGETVESYSHVVANWAEQAADFPAHRIDQWKKLIRGCFNTKTMFATKLEEITELKEYCESNIAPGSIHYHTLMEVLREGVRRHTGFLGYHILDAEGTDEQTKAAELVTNAELESIASRATDEPPKKEDYPNSMEFLKAKLAYRVYMNMLAKQEKEMQKQVVQEQVQVQVPEQTATAAQPTITLSNGKEL